MMREACEGAEVVISTASSTLSRQEGDSIETVDRIGQLSLIETARGLTGHMTAANSLVTDFSASDKSPTHSSTTRVEGWPDFAVPVGSPPVRK
jgi:hypothetical protein